jgi:anti-anti-sigma factor
MSIPNSVEQIKEYDETMRLNRLASIGQISAGIAHEVKNPLTSVKGFLQLLKEEIKHDYLDIAMSELGNALNTLNDLLQVSRPELGSEDYVYINLYSELESIISLFQDQMYRVTITTDYQNEDKVVYGKKNALKKVFFNLLKNAFEAIEGDGQISIKHYSSSRGLVIQIKDSGVGIPPEKLEMLGTPFFSTKENGTGMGLTQVFTTLNEHGAKVSVKSEVKKGTTFTIIFPTVEKRTFEVKKMTGLKFVEGQSFQDYISLNRKKFDEQLEDTMQGIFDEIKDSILHDNYLYDHAQKIIDFIHHDAEHQLIQLAKEHGENWAKGELPTALNLEWFKGLRDVYWDFLYNFYKNANFDVEQFFMLEKKTNHYLDTFLKQCTISYNEYKEQLLLSQREVIEELTVPLISLSKTVGILPIVGTIDTYRAKMLQEKSLQEIEKLRLKKIILDLSGVAYMDTAVVGHLFNIVEGYKILGCKTILTGIRSEIANTMVEMGIKLSDKVETFGDLQQALEEYNLT